MFLRSQVPSSFCQLFLSHVEDFKFDESHLSILTYILNSWIPFTKLLPVFVSSSVFPVFLWYFQNCRNYSGSLIYLNWFFYRVRDRDLCLSFCMWRYNFPNTILRTGCLFSGICFLPFVKYQMAKTVSFYFWIFYSISVSNIDIDTVSILRNNKETSDTSNTTDPMDLTDKWEHPASSSRAHVPLHRSVHSPGKSRGGHKTSLNEFQKTEITPSIFSDHKDK
jgi:hypothetical protein